MFETIYLLIALLGSSVAGIIDLKTTNVPDPLIYSMIGSGIVLHLAESIYIDSFEPFLLSIEVGALMLIFGLLMYYMGQWGGADAGMLAAIGFLLPVAPVYTFFPFPLTYFINLTFIGAIYSVIYVIYLMRKPGIKRKGLDFYRKIPTSKLKVDDVIGEDIPKISIRKNLIRGLTEKEIKKIRKHKKYVIVREGIPYVIVFPIALIVTLYLGDLILLIV